MRSTVASRRDFLRACGWTAVAAAGNWGRFGPTVAAAADDRRGESAWVDLSEHLSVFRGPIQVGVLRDGPKALLIDCGDGRVLPELRRRGITSVPQVLFTHHHRDQACGASAFVELKTRLVVPSEERDYFEKVAAYWSAPASRWHIYNQHPHHLMLAEAVPVAGVVGDGQKFSWGPAKIEVLATPGHTDGAVSYVVDVDGRRVIFCGDTIYDSGQIWELYSLQKGTMTTDYHGFLGARPQLVKSLARIKEAAPQRLIPSHGRIIDDPARAIDALVRRLDQCYDNYVAISALRHYFPKMFAEYAGRKDHMPIRPGNPIPDCLRHIGTTWLLVSKDKAAFVMDCGSPAVIQKLTELRAKGEIRAVEGLWVTHYHDDHVNAIPDFQKTFDCPCITDQHVAMVITEPLAWRLPCISPSKVRVDRATSDGQSWQWREFRLTAFHLPGQTLYHAGLLVESGDLRMFFVGDSFTMAGIDDYCAHNRNWLGAGVGFDRCIALIEKLRPTHLFNCHVDKAFDFTAEECRFMRANLAEREKLFGALFPWDHANYGMDELWVRCHPYEQQAKPGAAVTMDVVATNHSPVARALVCRAILPHAWQAGPTAPKVTDWKTAEAPPKGESRVRIDLTIPANTAPGRYVVAVDVKFADHDLPQFTEAIVVV